MSLSVNPGERTNICGGSSPVLPMLCACGQEGDDGYFAFPGEPVCDDCYDRRHAEWMVNR